MNEDPPTQTAVAETPPVSPPPAPPSRFEDFMSTSIGDALKENPRMPSLQKDFIQEQNLQTNGVEPPAPSEGQQGVQGQPGDPEPPSVAAPVLPDFSKLAFGQEIAAKVTQPEGIPSPEIKPSAPVEILSPDQFPEKFPGKSTPQVEQAWASMRKANKALFEKNAELTVKINEANEKLKEFDGKAPMDKDEFERITNERTQLSNELRLVKLEATPEYKAAVTKPLVELDGEIKRLSTKYSLNEHQMRRAIVEQDPDKQSELLAQITDTFNDRDKLNLFKVADATLEIMRKREVLHRDVQQALGYIEAKRTAEEEARTTATKSEWTSSLNKAWNQVGEALYLARPIEGNEQWNQELEVSKQLVARTDLAALNSVDRAKVMVQAALLPRACNTIQQLWNMYSQAMDILKRYQGTTPGAGGGRSGVGTEATTPTLPQEMSFLDAVEAKIKAR